MEIKVGQVKQSTPVEQTQSTQPTDGSFKFMLASHIEESELQTRLQGLMEEITMQGHAIECRINAENPALDFRPSPGEISSLYMPGGPGVRIDSAVYAGYTIPPYYDSMIAKLIVHAATRREAIMKMRWALAEFLVEGVDTNIDFQLSLLHNKEFTEGDYDIGFLDRLLHK